MTRRVLIATLTLCLAAVPAALAAAQGTSETRPQVHTVTTTPEKSALPGTLDSTVVLSRAIGLALSTATGSLLSPQLAGTIVVMAMAMDPTSDPPPVDLSTQFNGGTIGPDGGTNGPDPIPGMLKPPPPSN